VSRKTVEKNVAKVRRPARPAALEMLEGRTLLSAAAVGVPEVMLAKASAHADGTATAPASALTPAQIQSAYGVSRISLPNVATANGAGQTIAIVDAYNDPNALSDLDTFDANFGLANPPSFKVLSQTGGTTLPATDTETKPNTWELEESLDIEWAHAIAPGANIDLFEAKSTSLSDLYAAVTTAKGTAGVSTISMSFSTSGDFSGESSYDSVFTSNTGHGVTFLAATGDSGGTAGYPAVSPNVVGVGGTSLTTNSTGTYEGETAWSGSSGGLSTLEPQPSYQKGVVTQSATERGAPDVSMDASPSTGVAVYDSFDGSSTGGNWFQVGGTSLATPMWAGLIAIADQGRVANGLGTYDGRTGTLPRLYTLPASDFNDVTSGSDSNYSAGAGYDLVTGRGSPIANKLVPDLANVATTTPIPPTNPTPTAPVIASLTSSANPATVNKSFTITANGVADSTAAVTSVSFYYETNGKTGLQTGSAGDTPLGTVTNGAGGWKLNLTASAAGSYTLYAIATAGNGVASAPVSLTVVVQRTATIAARISVATASAPSVSVGVGFEVINVFTPGQDVYAINWQATDVGQDSRRDSASATLHFDGPESTPAPLASIAGKGARSGSIN
jgi:subtilase family serine protease